MTTLTPHGLQTQAFQDRDWHTKLNDTITRVNDRLPRSYAGDPNGNVEGLYIGQPIFDSTNEKQYICTTTGIAADAVWKQVVVPTFEEVNQPATTEIAYAETSGIAKYRRGFNANVVANEPLSVHAVRIFTGDTPGDLTQVAQNTLVFAHDNSNKNWVLSLEYPIHAGQYYQFVYDQVVNGGGVASETFIDTFIKFNDQVTPEPTP